MKGFAFEKTGITQAVILNLFQDNMAARTVMLKQVQHDGFGDKKIHAYYGGAK